MLVPPVATDRSSAAVEHDGREIATLVYDASLDDDPELVEAVCAAAAIALENERLQAESAARLVELRASRERIVAAGDAERRRLERNLHDGAQQRLVAIALQLRLLQAGIQSDPAAAEQLATAASDELALSLDELRELARGIHPAVLEHGLAAALAVARDARSVVDTSLAYELPGRLPEPVELAAYFVASEALANVAKYAQASPVRVRVWREHGRRAHRDRRRRRRRRRRRGGSGLRGLADRVEALDGHAARVEPARRRARPCARSCRAGRRSPTTACSCARASSRSCASAGSTSWPRPAPPRSCCRGRRPRARRGDRRHPHAADVRPTRGCARRTRSASGIPRWGS